MRKNELTRSIFLVQLRGGDSGADAGLSVRDATGWDQASIGPAREAADPRKNT